jgi:hypothetical protein
MNNGDDVRVLKNKINLTRKESETIVFTATIAMVGIAESMVHGRFIRIAPALPLVAALQLIAGLRLGPLRGLIAAVIGTYISSAYTYWSFAFVDVIQSPLFVGSAVNAFLPSVLSRLFQTAPFRVKESKAEKKAIFTLFFFLASVIFIEVLPILIGMGGWTYRSFALASALLFSIVASSIVLLSTTREKGQVFSLLVVLIISSVMSAVIGSTGAIFSAKWNAITDTMIPWLLWDLICSIAGIQLLVMVDLGALQSNTQITDGKAMAFQTKYKRFYHALVYLLCLAYFVWIWYNLNPDTRGCDLQVYLNAARGDYSGYRGMSWLYPRFTALLWKPFLHLDFETAFAIMFSVGCLSYLWLTHELLKKDMGGLIAFTGLEPFGFMLTTGNIYPLLAALATNPLGIIVGTLFKFPIAGIGLILFFVQYRRHKADDA